MYIDEPEQERNLHGQVLVLSKNSIVQLDVISVNKTINYSFHYPNRTTADYNIQAQH